MKNNNLRGHILNIILNYVQKRQWIDYDNFCDQLTDKIMRERPASKSDLFRVVNELKTPFFQLNKVDRKIFVTNIPELPLKQLGNSGLLPKILFLTANPKDTVTLRLDQELRDIEHKMLLAKMRDKFILVKKGAVRIGDLQFYLNQERPTIVHFSGHGSEIGEIMLEDNNGRAKSVPSKALARVFKILKDNIKCVVLNACFSLDQARAINQHIDCVIGMSSSISDKAAITFSCAFYLALASGRSIKNAFEQGINEIMLWQIPEENIPQLLTRHGVNPSRIVIVHEKK